MIRTLTTKLKAEAGFLVLLLVAAAGAWLYVEYQRMRADRDDAVQRAEIICAKAQSDWAATKSAKRGVVCARQVADLLAFRTTTDQETARLLGQAIAEANDRTLKDNLAARAAAEAARNAALRMEAADAEADRRNIVDREWTAAVNGVAGLRAPPR
ncbi:hypothetical protein [uncultured Sphingomonas sp.]|uniref:hypothetical protein n=1 Tax=uncultured Sphingomonas sp. TaxID=158754 RepID=UPI0025D078D7|nr:hypothetical protein [uncultured Sphingomonas sp.]